MAKSSDSNSAETHLKMLEAILATAVDAIITIDKQGVVLTANPATEKLFGYASDEVIGLNVNMLMPSPFREQHNSYLANYLETGLRKIIGIGREVIGLRRDGTQFPIHLAVSEFTIGNERLFAGIVRDISDVKQAEAQLAEINEQLEQRVAERSQELRWAQVALIQKEKLATLGEMAGGIAHEIRNPLNALKTSSYYLLNAPSVNESKAREHLERISRQVTIVDNIVAALSEVARLPDPFLRRTSLEHTLTECLNSLATPPNIHVATRVPADLPCVFADENQMPIVFRNLLVNAVEAMPNGGTLTISAESNPLQREVTVTIADTGIGIRPIDLARIMEPMFSTKAKGMGLGLTISRTILNKNSGRLTVTSEEGKGSQFHVTLPMVRE